MQDVLGQRLDARLVLVVLSAADERGVLIVKATVGRLRHSMLISWETAGTTCTVEVSLYVFCPARELAR